MIFDLFKYKGVSKEEYERFIETGKVKRKTLNGIVDKVIKQKALTTEEQAIFFSKTTEVNERFRQLHGKQQ
jgi:hypothetical protein